MAYSDASEAWPTSPRTLPSGDFLKGCGASGEEIRRFDWGATSLGPIEGWPISLKTTVRLVLTARQPMCFISPEYPE